MDQQEQWLRLVLDNLPALVAFLNAELHYKFANQIHKSWFGLNPDDLEGKHFSEAIGKDAYTILEPHIKEALSGKRSSFMDEIPFARVGKRYTHVTVVPLSPNSGKTAGILLLLTDVTEQKALEQKLDATLIRNKSILDTAVDGIITINEKGTIQSCNPGIKKIFGYSPDELLGQNVKKLMPSEYADHHDGYLQRYLKTGEKRIIGVGREVKGKRKDGSIFPMELSVGEFTENGNHFFTGFVRDITDRKKIEYEARSRLDELAHISRVNTNHHLASNISHEISQPLTAVVTMAQALLRSLHAEKIDPVILGETLEKIVKQSIRANNVIQQMRKFYGKGHPETMTPNNVDDIINDVLLLLDHDIERNSVNVKKQLETSDTLIHVNRVQIEQVILNLIQNAIEAMSENTDKRILTIKTHGPQKDCPYVKVSIEDNGHGLPDDKDRIFDSFYTTKEKGMGQGLAISHSIIETHGGTISVDTNNGRGAVFTFTLPLDSTEFDSEK